MRKERITVRLNSAQMLVLSEMSQALNTSYSMLVRTIVGDWLNKNEEHIYRIIDNKTQSNADYQHTPEETEG